MGCDIHAYIEYEQFTSASGEPYWSCFAGNFGDRDYEMFGHLAGVRGGRALFPPRGLPEGELSWQVRHAAFLHVNDEMAAKGVENYCTTGQVESWGVRVIERDDATKAPLLVHHPDWHSHSWLTTDELAQVIGTYIIHSSEYPYNTEWDAALAAMRAFEERGKQTRLIFWFDN